MARKEKEALMVHPHAWTLEKQADRQRNDTEKNFSMMLRNGVMVLARVYTNELGQPEFIPMCYQTRTQAERKAMALGDRWSVYKEANTPFYVMFTEETPK